MKDKVEILVRLKQLRVEIEEGQGGLSAEQACLLTDVCDALGLDEDAEKFYVVGAAFNAAVIQPIPYQIAGDSELVDEFAGLVTADVMAPQQAGGE